ncbi:MAG TPA: DUF3313 family protein [Candidatus Binataceae bacterium]|nr:DUF3313 family protein [Candidatus Binataceae bacterium]
MRLRVRAFALTFPMALVVLVPLAAIASGCLSASVTPVTPERATAPNEAIEPPAAAPRPASEGFLPEPERMSALKDVYPFDKAWVKPDADFARYRGLRIAPVTIAYLTPIEAGSPPPPAAEEQHEAAVELALYINRSFTKAILNDQSGRLRIVEQLTPNTIIAEVAIVELWPSRAGVPAAASATPRVPSAEPESKAPQRGSIGMEARLRDGATGEIIGMFSDRRSARVLPLSTTGAEKWSFANEIIDDWTEEIVAAIEARPGEKPKGGATQAFKER